MKKIGIKGICLGILLLGFSQNAFAGDGGEMGSFGGISEGVNLPFTMDAYVDSGAKEQTEFNYKEVVFLSGTPVECTGTMTIDRGKVDFLKKPTGTYDEEYIVEAVSADGQAIIDREISFVVSYRVIESEFVRQIVRNPRVESWEETITVSGVSYTLDERASAFSTMSSVEHLTPGVSYFDKPIYYEAHYLSGDHDKVISIMDGKIYGYTQPWSKIERQELNMRISYDEGRTYETVIALSPYLEAKKTLYYDETNAFPISFGGSYNQRLEREATLTYQVISSKNPLSSKQKSGSLMISPVNQIEKLPIPGNLDFLQGHWAEEDFKKLYSMEVFTETPQKGMQFQAMLRGEFVKALCLAMDIDTSKYEKVTRNSPQIFGDVPKEHPLYKYIMAAYDTKLIKGIGEKFDVDVPITRQEAFVIYVRVIGLERLGITDSPQTPFVDDSKIAPWAKKEIMAGYKLGIIRGDAQGKVLPTNWISKSESAAIINRLIDYLRDEIAVDYKK